MPAQLDGSLTPFNIARVVVLDVTEDYVSLRNPLPPLCYPVVTEMWLPRINMPEKLAADRLLEGYLYDWHVTPDTLEGIWYVGVVDADKAGRLIQA